MPVNLKQTSLGILCLPFREKDGRVSPGAPTHLISSSHREQLAAKPAPTLYIAIPGIEELDLCAPADSILTFEDGVQILSPGVFGPPSPNTYFLVLGRATTTLKGLTVHPSLVDNDYTREIKILVSAPLGLVLARAQLARKNDAATGSFCTRLFSPVSSCLYLPCLYISVVYISLEPWASHSYILSVPIHSQQATSPHQAHSFS
jgi:hypothetical protein